MKRKRLALLLAVALTATSVENMALVTSAADFTAASPTVEVEADEPEVTENQETDEEIAEASTEDVSEDIADIEFSDGNDAVETEEEMTDRAEAITGESEKKPELISEENEADFVSAGEESVVPDEGISEMAVNGVYDVDIDQENECKWFSFIPEEDGEYSFYATGSYETEGYFFDSKEYTKTLEWYKGTYDQYDSNSGPDNNFKFNKTLKAGVTYYYCVKMSNYDTGSFNVKLVKTKVLQSIQATLKQTKIEAGVYDGNSGLGYIQSYLEATVQYKFTDGTIEVAEKQMGEEWVPRTESLETATIDIVDSEGNEQSDRLSKGKYAAVFSVDNIKSEPVEFQVVDVEDTSVYYGILHEGDNPGTKTPENNRAYYKFIPSQTGTYMFKNCADCSLYEKDENGILRHPDHEDGVSPVQQAGKEYYIRLSGEVWSDDTQDYEEECNLNIRMQRTITSISFVPENTEVYNNIDNIENNWTQIGGNITLTYNDGSVWSGDVERCQLGYSDDDGNWLDTIIKDEEGHTVLGYGGLSAGIYQVSFKLKIDF